MLGVNNLIYDTNSLANLDSIKNIPYLTEEESQELRSISNISLRENTRLNKNLIRFAEAVRYMRDTSSSLLDFIYNISESNNIPIDTIAFSALASDLANEENHDLMREINEGGFKIYPETHSCEDLDAIVEYCIENETLKPLMEIYGSLDRANTRFTSAMRSGFVKNLGYGAAYAGSQALAGAKAGVANFISKKGADAVSGAIIPKKIKKKYAEFDAEYETDAKGNRKLKSKGNARQFTDSILGGVKGQISGNVKNAVSNLLGVETRGGVAYNKPGMLNLVTSKMHTVEGQMQSAADPEKRSFLRKVLDLLARIRNKILNTLRGHGSGDYRTYPT